MMEQILGSDWMISPAGGTSGEAFIAEKENNKLFLKRNSNPFIAILSAEGIVPKLMWTKRLSNGDVITAQKWMEGRELTRPEMQNEEVVGLLSKIHHSSEILDLFMRMGKKPVSPSAYLIKLLNKCKKHDMLENESISQATRFLSRYAQEIDHEKKVVCHSDMFHENWLKGEDDHLYLIDWDQAIIADPALDLSMFLWVYVPRNQWSEWLHHYGLEETNDLLERMNWYLVAQTISYILWHIERRESEKVDQWLQFLQEQQFIYRKY